eukprot:4823841-Karenia_brevis.AAC.1
MPHKHSRQKRAERSERAIKLGFLEQRTDGQRCILVPSHLAWRAKAQVKSLRIHDECTQVTGRSWHRTSEAIVAARHVLGPTQTRAYLNANRNSARARHDWVVAEDDERHCWHVDGAIDVTEDSQPKGCAWHQEDQRVDWADAEDDDDAF